MAGTISLCLPHGRSGVLRLLSSFDPNVPLAITDNIWFYSAHPNPGAPRCLPCSFNTSTIHTVSQALHSHNARHCWPAVTPTL